MYHSFSYTHVITSRKFSIKIHVVTDEGNSRNETWHWTNNEIGLGVQSSLLVRVELMAWWFRWLERLNGIQWSWFQISLSPTFYSYFEEPFNGEYHIYIYIYIYIIYMYIYIYIYILYIYIYIYIYINIAMI